MSIGDVQMTPKLVYSPRCTTPAQNMPNSNHCSSCIIPTSIGCPDPLALILPTKYIIDQPAVGNPLRTSSSSPRSDLMMYTWAHVLLVREDPPRPEIPAASFPSGIIPYMAGGASSEARGTGVQQWSMALFLLFTFAKG